LNENELRLLEQLSNAHEQLSRLLETEKTVAAHMAAQTNGLPDHRGAVVGAEKAYKHAGKIQENVIAYLNGIAGVLEVLADHTGLVLRQEEEDEDDEE